MSGGLSILGLSFGSFPNGWTTIVVAFAKGHIAVRQRSGGRSKFLMKVEMTQLYLCEEPYWSKYDQSDLYDHPIEINVISDGEYLQCAHM